MPRHSRIDIFCNIALIEEFDIPPILDSGISVVASGEVFKSLIVVRGN
jgi:hypothetical protein